MTLQFTDMAVPYEVFVRDVAQSVVSMLNAKAEPEYISQREAYKLFGRASVTRWREQGKIEPCIRPGKVEYRVEDLRKLQKTIQDYFV